MFRSKKFIIIAVLLAVAIAGCIGGVAIAQTEEEETQTETIYDKVTAVLNANGIEITSDQLKDAFNEVKSQQRTAAIEKILDKLVENDKISQEEADEYSQWWSEKPETLDGLGLRGRIGLRGMHRIQMFRGLCAPEAEE
jgi:hypothetical protein